MDALLEAQVVSASTGDNAFAAYCREQARRQGKRLWGEKTPRHTFQINQIRAALPQVGFVILVRAPRAVVASYRDWRNQWLSQQETNEELVRASLEEDRRITASYSLFNVAMLLGPTARIALRLANQHGPERVKSVHFEDLISRPGVVLEGLWAWRP